MGLLNGKFLVAIYASLHVGPAFRGSGCYLQGNMHELAGVIPGPLLRHDVRQESNNSYAKLSLVVGEVQMTTQERLLSTSP